MSIRKMIIDGCGPQYALRLFIKDGEGNYWNDKDGAWTSNFKDASLWVSASEIGEKQKELMLSQIPGEVQSFAVPLFVDVKAPEEVNIYELRKWLKEAVEIFMNAQHGTGPGDSMVMLNIDWEDLQSKEDIENG